MKVKEIMTSDVGFCFWQDNPARAIEIMRGKDCGIVPVVNREMKILGMLSDRDICLALANRAPELPAVEVKDFIKSKIVSCQADDKIKDILRKMRKNQVKRLPVTSQDGKLIGIISIADILLSERAKSLSKEILKAIKEISKPRPILLHEIG